MDNYVEKCPTNAAVEEEGGGGGGGNREWILLVLIHKSGEVQLARYSIILSNIRFSTLLYNVV